LEAILGRCVLDIDYGALLFADPDQAPASHVGDHLARGRTPGPGPGGGAAPL